MHALIAASFTSLQATLAPYFARASAIPLPMLGPTPVTRATLPSSEISTVNAPFLTGPDGPGRTLPIIGGPAGLDKRVDPRDRRGTTMARGVLSCAHIRDWVHRARNAIVASAASSQELARGVIR